MEDLIKMWQQYDEKLEKSLSLNRRIITELQQQKVKNALLPAKRVKWVSVLIGLVYIAFLGFGIYYVMPFGSIFLLSSIAIHLIVSVVAVAMYVRQLVLIHEINNSENVLQIQSKLAKIQSSAVKIVAICFLQLPVFATWNITSKMISETPEKFWFIQLPIVLLFTAAGIWLYKNVDPKNMDKKWFKIMFCGTEWSSVIRSQKMLKEIESFEKG